MGSRTADFVIFMEGYMRTVQRVLAGALILLSVSAGSASAQSNFALDVNDSIDDALNYMRSAYWGASPTFTPLLMFGEIRM